MADQEQGDTCVADQLGQAQPPTVRTVHAHPGNPNHCWTPVGPIAIAAPTHPREFFMHQLLREEGQEKVAASCGFVSQDAQYQPGTQGSCPACISLLRFDPCSYVPFVCS